MPKAIAVHSKFGKDETVWIEWNESWEGSVACKKFHGILKQTCEERKHKSHFLSLCLAETEFTVFLNAAFWSLLLKFVKQ